MPAPEAFRWAIEVMEANEIEYFVTGSLASMYWGKLRTTEDMDVVAALSLRHARPLIEAFAQPDYYISETAVLDTIEHGGGRQFNIVHLASTLKIDVVQTEDTPFAELQMSRRVRGQVMGLDAWIATAEDIILNKTRFYQIGGSEKHINDIAWIVQVRGDKLDWAYLDQWALRTGIAPTWQAIRQRLAEGAGPGLFE